MTWKTMEEWRTSGPSNGTRVLVLLADGRRLVAYFNGLSGTWIRDADSSSCEPIGWVEIPDVPQTLIDRLKLIADERARLDLLERSSL